MALTLFSASLPRARTTSTRWGSDSTIICCNRGRLLPLSVRCCKPLPSLKAHCGVNQADAVDASKLGCPPLECFVVVAPLTEVLHLAADQVVLGARNPAEQELASSPSCCSYGAQNECSENYSIGDRSDVHTSKLCQVRKTLDEFERRLGLVG